MAEYTDEFFSVKPVFLVKPVYLVGHEAISIYMLLDSICYCSVEYFCV